MAGTYTKLFYHLVFSTKHRSNFITPMIESDLHRYIAGIVRGIGGSCIENNGMADHVHLLTILPPKMALSDALREIKANSSKWVHETKPELAKFGWQDGYQSVENRRPGVFQPRPASSKLAAARKTATSVTVLTSHPCDGATR